MTLSHSIETGETEFLLRQFEMITNSLYLGRSPDLLILEVGMI